MSRLSEEQIEEIKREYTVNRTSYQALAKCYGVSSTTIGRIVNPSYAERERQANSARYKAKREIYERNRKRCVGLSLHNVYDADIIAKLESVPSKLGYIKELIRKDINKEK